MKNKVLKGFNPDLRMDLICASDSLRPALQCLYFKDGFVYATDSHMLVKNSFDDVLIGNFSEEELQILNSGVLLSASSYKSLLKYKYINIKADGIMAQSLEFEIFYEFKKDLTFPNIEAVFANSKKHSKVDYINLKADY